MMMTLLVAAASFFSCEEKTENLGLDADFYMTSDKDVIKSDGVDVAQLKVFLKGEDVTTLVQFYDGDSNPISLVDGKFASSQVGTFKFWASYGTYSTYNREYEDNGLYTIKAVSQDVPAPVADPATTKTNFVHRVLLTQYTGSGCGYCPYMIKIIKELIQKGTITSKAVLAAAHSGYNTNDPAAIHVLKAANYPYLHVDLVNGFTHNSGTAVLESIIDYRLENQAKAGIAVNPILYAEENKLIVTVSVKAAEEATFNVGAWLLEDGIYAAQADNDNVGDDSYDTHNNCIRIVDSNYNGTYFGRLVGDLAQGQVAHKTFVMDLKSKWVKENLHLAVFVSSRPKESRRMTDYSVCNAVDCPITEATPFEYKN